MRLAREIRDAAGGEADPGVGDVNLVGQHRHAHRVDGRHIRANQRQQHVQIMDHQVEDDIDVETSRGKGTKPVHLDEARVRHERQGDADGWIITLGMADREGRARRRRGGDHLIRVRDDRAMGFSTRTATHARETAGPRGGGSRSARRP